MKLPLFPLPVYLLPSGVTQLRIFEQRYLTMVRNSQKTNGFVIVHTVGDDRISEWGSWVDIVDFDQGDDGVLNLLVKCKHLVSIGETERQPDQLLTGEVEVLPHWPETTSNDRCIQLKHQLQRLFEDHPSLQKLYSEPQFDNYDWVCARWLELLPVSFENKRHFAHPNSFLQAVDFLTTIIFDEKPS
ncbi:LON peptidase substrate-binding domain-containing protein [Thalassotalea euphylliae]|uniref:LON peptidase substrate-binding domain-containing protein n=1 Tax=Thalassotalea euphylliae TaxID=1655234 RepID=UPI00362E4F56